MSSLLSPLHARWRTSRKRAQWVAGTVLTHKRVNSSKKRHPTEKPIPLMSDLVKNSGAEVIADPFMGSGSTGVACALAGLRFIGMELDEGYFDAACERIQAAYAEANC